jgi:hypothetical protein
VHADPSHPTTLRLATGLYGRETDLERMYLYNWGGIKIPMVLQAEGGEPTPAARSVEALQRWLSDAASRSCGHGRAIGLSTNAWRCDLVVGRGADRREAAIVWTHSGTTAIKAPANVRVHRLDGRITPVASGDDIVVSEEPVLVVGTG